MALRFTSFLFFFFWQCSLFFAHSSLPFTFTWGVACNYWLVNTFLRISCVVQRLQSSERSVGREVCSYQTMANSHQEKKPVKAQGYQALVLTPLSWIRCQSSSCPLHLLWYEISVLKLHRKDRNSIGKCEIRIQRKPWILTFLFHQKWAGSFEIVHTLYWSSGSQWNLLWSWWGWRVAAKI